MGEFHWRTDERPIIAVCLPEYPFGGDGIFLASDGWGFERFEHSGEMASVPFLRMTKDERSIEASLRSFAWIEVGHP